MKQRGSSFDHAVRRPSASRRDVPGPGSRFGVRGRLLSTCLLLLAMLLAPAACKKGPTEPPPTPDASALEGSEAALVGGRPALPPRSAGLAQISVFPEVDAPLALLRSEPADGAEGVAVGAEEARIVLRFNHPVVPLVTAGQQDDLPTPARIEPAIEGAGEWLDSSTWLYTPAEDLRPSTEYRVEIDGDLEDLLGARLGEDRSLGFTTAWPAVLRSRPESGAIDAGATMPISVTFNQSMDRASTEAAFGLRSAGEGGEVDGDFRWDSDRTLIFEPAAALERATRYEVTIAAGAEAAGGGAESPEPTTWGFETAPRPRLLRSVPADGEEASTALRGGDLTLVFNTPMDREALTVTIQPTITNQGLWLSEDGREAHVTGGWLASREYTVTLPADTPARSGDELGEPVTIRFGVAPMAPYFSLRTTGRFTHFEASEPVEVYGDAMNLEAAELALYRLDAEQFLRLTSGEDRWQAIDQLAPGSDSLLRRWDLDTRAPVDVGRRISVTLAAEGASRLPAGVYYLESGEADAPAEGRGRTVLTVSDVNLTLKQAPEEVLVWATDLSSAEPVAGLSLSVFEQPGQPLASGVTDADGIFRAPIERRLRAWEPLVVLGRQGEQLVAAVSSEWATGIEPYAFNIGYDPEPRDWYGTVYSDRPLYRPGQTVHFRGALRADEDASYRLPELDSVRVVVRDPDWEPLLEADLPLSDFGTFEGSVELSPLARLGGYQIEVSVGGSEEARDDETELPPVEPPSPEPVTVTGASFDVLAYRKPDFEVEVTTDRAEYLQGETIDASATASYFFGGPVVDAEVRWRLLSDDFFFSPPDVEGRWDWIDYDLTEARMADAQGEVVAEGQGRTDAEGRFDFEVPADLSEYPLGQVFTIDVEVVDLDGRAVAGRNSAVVHKADLYIGLRPEEYVAESGEPAGFQILALDPEGRPVADRDIELQLYHREWYSVRERREGGAYFWTSAYTDSLVSELEATTDQEGRARVAPRPERAGVHRLVARARDAAGNEAQSATYLWVTGSGFVNWRQENNDRIELVADKKQYAPGDVARVLVPSPFEGAQALVTLERGGILSVRRMELEGNSETLEIPIEAEHVPNVYVSVLLLRGEGPDSPLPQIKLGYTNLPVSSEGRELEIRLEPDKTGEYAPRQSVTWTISARDADGRPAEAEFSLALVDKALLSLTDRGGPDLQASFYGQRMLSVGTAAGLTQSGRRLAQELAAERKGGGGGPGGEAGTVRRLFEDTAFWAPSVRTDAAGQARVSLQLPDNLTTWEMAAHGLTADTRVGSAREEILSTQTLLIQPVLPRFLVVGDDVQVEAVVQNRGAEDLDIQVDLSAIGLDLEGESLRSAELPAGGKVKVVWAGRVPERGLNPAQLPESFGQARLQMRAGPAGADLDAVGAGGDVPGDAIEIDLPVYRFSAPELVATAGQVEDRVTERIVLPESADLSQGELSLELEPSLAAAALTGLDWLWRHPSQCVEQIAGRLMGQVSLWQALGEAGAEAAQGDPELRSRLADWIRLDIQRLAALQGGSGGWGWCAAGGEPQTWLSATAAAALGLAETAGFTVPQRVMDGATGYLTGQLDAPVDAEADWDLDQRAYIVWALSERQAIPLSRATALYERRAGLGVEGRAFLALALAALGEGSQAERLDGLLADLSAGAEQAATGAWWEAPDEPFTFATERRATAVASYALARLDPEATVLPGALRWLQSQRREGHWPGSQETTWAVMAMTAWMRATGEMDADYSYHVELNDAELETGRVDAASVDEARSLEVPAADLEPVNELVIRQDGRGRLYYQAELRVYQAAESLPAQAEGIVLGRSYHAVDPATFEAHGEAIDQATVGDLVEARLTLVAETSLHHLRLEDFVPAGFEIVDTSLRSTSAAASGPQLEQADAPDAEDLPWWRRPWWLGWSDSQLRDERAILLAPHLEPGTYVYRYLLRAGVAGNYHVRPAVAELSWLPEVFGRSAGGVFVIEPGD